MSNLSFLSKLVEKYMWLQLSTQFQEYSLIPDSQSAYWPEYSYETCLLKLSNNILWNFQHQHITALTTMDLLASFNMVAHSVLLSIVSAKFGVEGTALDWFKSYLQPTQFKVNV